MDPVIRPAREDEVGEILALWLRADAVVSSTDDPASVRGLVERDQGALLVAEVEGAIVGTLIASWDGWRGGMYRLAVLPELRRQGIARRLVREGERRLAELGAKRIAVVVVREHDHAAGFWRALGYEPDDRVDRYVRSLAQPSGGVSS